MFNLASSWQSQDQRRHQVLPGDPERQQEIQGTLYGTHRMERVNNRILNNYHLLDLKIRGDYHYSFWGMLIGICIYLDVNLNSILFYS